MSSDSTGLPLTRRGLYRAVCILRNADRLKHELVDVTIFVLVGLPSRVKSKITLIFSVFSARVIQRFGYWTLGGVERFASTMMGLSISSEVVVSFTICVSGIVFAFAAIFSKDALSVGEVVSPLLVPSLF